MLLAGVLPPEPANAPAAQPPHDDPGPPRFATPGLLATTSGRLLAGAAGALALLTVIGLVALWPGALAKGGQKAFGGSTLGAHVTTTDTVRCPGPTAQRCRRVTVRIDDGPDAGRRAVLDLGPVELTPSLSAGDAVRVQRSEAGAPQRYAFADVDRRAPMLWLLVGVAVLAALVARWRGVLALVGVALSPCSSSPSSSRPSWPGPIPFSPRSSPPWP